MEEYLESKKILAMLWSFSLTLSSGTALATCVTGDCTSLGYTKSASDCSGVDYIRCPFDVSKYYCVKPTCTVNTCEGYPLTTPPQNAKYSSCTKRDSNCAEQGTVYKIDSCNDGYVQSGNGCESVSSSPEDLCAGITCSTGVSCQYGCAEYTTGTSCCTSVCKTCKPNPCDDVKCPVATEEICTNGCGSYSEATACCPSVCTSCASSPDVDASGCDRSCTPTDRARDEYCQTDNGYCELVSDIDNCGCGYRWLRCWCGSEH